MTTGTRVRRGRSPFAVVVLLLTAIYLLYLSLPNLGFAIRTARADGTPGAFTARSLSCVRHPGHQSCSWTGDFRSRDGRITRTGVFLHGSDRASLRPGTAAPAIDIGRPGQVYGPGGSREWIPTTLLLTAGMAILIYLTTRALGLLR